MSKRYICVVFVILCMLFANTKAQAQETDSSCDMRYYNLPTDAKLQSLPPVTTSKPTFKPLIQDKPATHRSPHPIATPTEIESMINQYGDQYGVDKQKLKSIAYCESRFNPSAVNGPYGGMYQYLASTWSSTRKEMGLDPNPDLRFNAEESIRTTAYKIAKQGTGPWPVCGRG